MFDGALVQGRRGFECIEKPGRRRFFGPGRPAEGRERMQPSSVEALAREHGGQGGQRHAEPLLGEADLVAARRAEADVGHEQQHGACGDRVAFARRHHPGRALERLEQQLAHGCEQRFTGLSAGSERRVVEPGAERVASAAQDDHRCVGVERKRLTERFDRFERQRIGSTRVEGDEAQGRRAIDVDRLHGGGSGAGGPHGNVLGVTSGPQLYGDLAAWWPLFSRPEEYVEEAAFFAERLGEACTGAATTLLELGSGGGNNASHMKSRFESTLVDLSPQMLEVSRALNPECDHVEGDMRRVRLGRTFDCVFVHDAIALMTTEADLRAVFETAFAHCRPGGAALFAPDHVRETFAPATDDGGHDADGRGVRFLEWSFDPDPADRTIITDYAILLRDRGGETRVVHDRHVEGLFARADWLRWLREAGFEPDVVRFDHSDLEPGSYEIFVCRRPED